MAERFRFCSTKKRRDELIAEQRAFLDSDPHEVRMKAAGFAFTDEGKKFAAAADEYDALCEQDATADPFEGVAATPSPFDPLGITLEQRRRLAWELAGIQYDGENLNRLIGSALVDQATLGGKLTYLNERAEVLTAQIRALDERGLAELNADRPYVVKGPAPTLPETDHLPLGAPSRRLRAKTGYEGETQRLRVSRGMHTNTEDDHE